MTISPTFTKSSPDSPLTSSVALGAATELENMWDELAKRLTEAGGAELSLRQSGDPKLVGDPATVAAVQWLNVFKTDLDAVASVVDAVKAGAELSFEDIQAAVDVGQYLLKVYDSAQGQVAQAAMSNGSHAAVAHD